MIYKTNLLLIFFIYFFSVNDFVKPEKLPLGLTINPYKQTPLSGVYRIAQKNALPLTITVLGKKKDASVSYTYPKGYGCVFPIHGLYNQYTNQLLIILGEEKIVSTNIFIENVYKEQNQQYPRVIPSRIRVHKTIAPLDPFNQDFYFMYDNYTNIAAYDKRGDLRYLYQKDNTMNLLARMELTNDNIYFYFVDKKMYRINLLGQERYFPTDNIIVHHDFSYKGTHKIILAFSERGGMEDRLIEVDAKGEIIRDLVFGDLFRNVLDPKDWTQLDQTVYDTNNLRTNRITKKEEQIDWAHANALIYDEENDIIYLSLRHLGVLAVNYSEWKLLWWLADNNMNTAKGKSYGEVPADFVYLDKIPALASYRLKSTTYPRNQHGLLLKSNGNLLMFDNRGDSSINFRGSRILEYQITKNTNRYTALLVRQYRHPRRVYSRLLSDVDLVGKDHQNLLILWGFDNPITPFKTTRLAEVDPNNNLIMDMSLGVDWVYRVEKKPLYPYQDTNKKYSIDALKNKEQ